MSFNILINLYYLKLYSLLLLLVRANKLYLPSETNTQPLSRPWTHERFEIQICTREDILSYEIETFPKHFTQEELNTTSFLGDVKPNNSLCQKRKIEYNLFEVETSSKIQKFKNLIEFASIANHILLLDVTTEDSKLLIYLIKKESSKIKLEKVKTVDLKSMLNLNSWEELSQKDIVMQVSTDFKFVFFRVKSRILVYNIQKPNDPIFLGDFVMSAEEFWELKKTFFFDNFFFKIFKKSINVTIFNSNNNSFEDVQLLEFETIGKLIKEKYNRDGVWQDIKDIWVEKDKLYLLDSKNGLIVLKITQLLEGSSNFTLLSKDLLYYEQFEGGYMLKKIDKSISIALENKETQGVRGYFQIVEYMEIEGANVNNPYTLQLNRIEGLNFTKIKSLHRTKDFLLIEQENFLNIMRHSFPNMTDSQPDNPLTTKLTPGLMSLHHAYLGSRDTSNIIMAIYPYEVLFYEVKTDAITVTCNPKRADDMLTIVAYIKKQCNVTDSNENKVCEEKLISYVDVEGRDDTPDYKLIFSGVANIGWLAFFVLLIINRNKIIISYQQFKQRKRSNVRETRLEGKEESNIKLSNNEIALVDRI